MRIGELARRAGVSERSLRHYEAQGLLTSRRDDNGYRVYDGDAVGRVGFISDLLDCGFATREIRGLLPCLDTPAGHAPCPEGWDQHRRKLAQIEASIRDLAERRRAIVARMEEMRGLHPESPTAGDPPSHAEDNPASEPGPVPDRDR